MAVEQQNRGSHYIDPSDLTIRPMQYPDLERVMEIEQACYPSPWSRKFYIEEILVHPIVHPWLLVNKQALKEIYGYIIFVDQVSVVHIINLAVDKPYRGMGFGRFLMNRCLSYCRDYGFNRCFLEVRPSNYTARRLYKSLGFKETGIKKGYYLDNGEDAIIMFKNFK